MSLVESIVVESRRYSGWLDPRYPIGYWQASLASIGNATGGTHGLDLVFQGALTPQLNSQMYSVERLAVATNDSNDRTVRLSATNMGGPANQGFLHEYSIQLDGQSSGGRSALRADSFSFLPWFLGSQRTPAVTASLSFVMLNVDGLLVTFEAEGYRWSPRSVLVDGGPQRPPTGLYRA